MTTRVFIIPADLKDAGDQMAMEMGWGVPVFVQPLSTTGQEPITYWGFPAVVGAEFLSIWDNPPEEAVGLVAATYTSDRDGIDTAGHWYAVLADQGLTAIELSSNP